MVMRDKGCHGLLCKMNSANCMTSQLRWQMEFSANRCKYLTWAPLWKMLVSYKLNNSEINSAQHEKRLKSWLTIISKQGIATKIKTNTTIIISRSTHNRTKAVILNF